MSVCNYINCCLTGTPRSKPSQLPAPTMQPLALTPIDLQQQPWRNGSILTAPQPISPREHPSDLTVGIQSLSQKWKQQTLRSLPRLPGIGSSAGKWSNEAVKSIYRTEEKFPRETKTAWRIPSWGTVSYLLYLPPRNPNKDQSPANTYISNFDAKESFPVVVENWHFLKLFQLLPDIPCIFSQLMGLINVWLDRKSTYSQLEEKRQACQDSEAERCF